MIIKTAIISGVTLVIGRCFLSFAKITTYDKIGEEQKGFVEEVTEFDWNSIVSDEKVKNTETDSELETSTINNETTIPETTTVAKQVKTNNKQVVKLPEKYDYRKIKKCPKVRNQGNKPYCWAYSSIAAVESSLMPRERYKFSPMDMVKYVKKRENVSDGGDGRTAMSYLLSWDGPCKGNNSSKTIKHIQSAQVVKGKKIKKIKELVYKYGGVTTSIYMNPSVMNHTSEAYKKSTSSLYYKKKKKDNHVVLIVGWNDKYPKEKFSTSPKKDGAFICMNSWGKSVGEKGFFYLSYEDKTFGKENVCFTQVESIDNYDDIYQYDECGNTSTISYKRQKTIYFSNVFKARRNEKLKAVGFYVESKNVNYEVYVNNMYVKKKSLLKTAKQDTKGTFVNRGFYTVKLNNDYNLKKDRLFCVTIKVKNKKGLAVAPVESSNKRIKVDLSKGKGFTSADGIYWDSAEKDNSNICLKAYTSN